MSKKLGPSGMPVPRSGSRSYTGWSYGRFGSRSYPGWSYVAVWTGKVRVAIGGGVERSMEKLSSLIRVLSGAFLSGVDGNDSGTPEGILVCCVEGSAMLSMARFFPFPARDVMMDWWTSEINSVVRCLRCWMKESLCLWSLSWDGLSVSGFMMTSGRFRLVRVLRFGSSSLLPFP